MRVLMSAPGSVARIRDHPGRGRQRGWAAHPQRIGPTGRPNLVWNQLTVSIGLAVSSPGMSGHDLIDSADQAALAKGLARIGSGSRSGRSVECRKPDEVEMPTLL